MAELNGNVSICILKKKKNYMKINFFFRWALKNGNPILSSAVVISNTMILNYYRKRLKLRNYGRFTLLLPVVLMPSIISLLLQNTVCVILTVIKYIQ